jgi:S1-C subfamily serine protease
MINMKWFIAILVLAIFLIAGCTQQVNSFSMPQKQFNSTNDSVVNETNSYQVNSNNTENLTQNCEAIGKFWCNENCYLPCPSNQRFICPSTGEPVCTAVRNISDVKKSIAFIKYNATGCCDHFNQYTSFNSSGSGVIFSQKDINFYILTSRHVVDCTFAGTCLYPKNETITITAQNGKTYTPYKIFYAPQNLDLIILVFQTTDENIDEVLLSSQNYSIKDKVIAVGYPTFAQNSTTPILDFSGSITDVYNLTEYNETSLIGIQSDALNFNKTNSGGLFDQDGQLAGIITWKDREQNISIAIGAKELSDMMAVQNKFFSCASDSYKNLGETCCPYGKIYGSDEKCYQPCGLPNDYCLSPDLCCNGICYKPCKTGYYLAENCGCLPYNPLGY